MNAWCATGKHHIKSVLVGLLMAIIKDANNTIDGFLHWVLKFCNKNNCKAFLLHFTTFLPQCVKLLNVMQSLVSTHLEP